jgi:flagellar protein FliS
MTHSVHVHYRDAGILSADPLQLVQMLYQAATESVAAARRHVRAANIQERSKAIMRAWEIINELRVSLDHSVGGEISRNLAALYAYMQRRLLEANAAQIESPLAEVEKLLSTLLEGWASAAAPARAAQNGTEQEHTAEYTPITCAY